MPKPPPAYDAFATRYPKAAEAWKLLAEASREGPLDAKTVRLLKLAVAIARFREGAVHANVRKALAAGIARDEIEQVVAVAAATIGLPGAVAVFTWVEDAVGGAKP